MTNPDSRFTQLSIAEVPIGPDTLALELRTIHDSTPRADLSRFVDDKWALGPASPDRHCGPITIHWTRFPSSTRELAKIYAFALLNVLEPPKMPFSRSTTCPSVKTVMRDLNFLLPFLRWIDNRRITVFSDVTLDDLGAYGRHTQSQHDRSTSWKRAAFLAVQRLHLYRNQLPSAAQLPAERPFGAMTAAQMANDPGPGLVNRTARIDPRVMETLLSAALLTVELVAADISTAVTRILDARKLAVDVASTERRRRAGEINVWGASQDQLERVIPLMHQYGLPIPAVAVEGNLTVDTAGMARAWWITQPLLNTEPAAETLRTSGLEYAKDWLVVTRFSQVNGTSWRSTPIHAHELRSITRHVITACFIVIAYLSGARSGEVLNLKRDCITRDQKLGLTFMTGNRSKRSSAQLPEAADTPWVVTDQVATAVSVLESFTRGQILFAEGKVNATEWFDETYPETRRPSNIRSDIEGFTDWFNHQIAPTTSHPTIPPDAAGPIQAIRFRRTLAWHIAHRPGGIVAGATQYGHVRTQIMQGYAGLADSGFVNELEFENLLLRAEDAHDRAAALEDGAHVSGPAQAEYRSRVTRMAEFAGTTITTKGQLNALRRTTTLDVHQGALVTCVYRKETAACRTSDDSEGPDLEQCKFSCPNRAYTDRDIAAVEHQLDELSTAAVEPLVPAPLRRRLQQRCATLERVIVDHASGPTRQEVR